MYYGASTGSSPKSFGRQNFQTQDVFVSSSAPRLVPASVLQSSATTPPLGKFIFLAQNKRPPRFKLGSAWIWKTFGTTQKKMEWRKFWIQNPDKRQYFSTRPHGQLDYNTPATQSTLPNLENLTFVDVMPQVTITPEGEVVKIPDVLPESGSNGANGANGANGSDLEYVEGGGGMEHEAMAFIKENKMWIGLGLAGIATVWWLRR